MIQCIECKGTILHEIKGGTDNIYIFHDPNCPLMKKITAEKPQNAKYILEKIVVIRDTYETIVERYWTDKISPDTTNAIPIYEDTWETINNLIDRIEELIDGAVMLVDIDRVINEYIINKYRYHPDDYSIEITSITTREDGNLIVEFILEYDNGQTDQRTEMRVVIKPTVEPA